MLKLFACSLMLFTLSTTAFAQSKEQLQGTLEMMKKNGLINEEQYQASLKQLKGMSDQEMAALKANAVKAASDPKVMEQVNKLKNSGAVAPQKPNESGE